MPNMIKYKDWLFVDVGKDASRFEIGGNYLYFIAHGGMSVRSRIEIGPGSWQIIGKGDRVGDTIWYGIVDKQDYRKGNYNDYWFKDYASQEYSLQDATSSGYSLVRSLGMEPEECLVLKKNEK